MPGVVIPTIAGAATLVHELLSPSARKAASGYDAQQEVRAT
jgi:hypothetical protein